MEKSGACKCSDRRGEQRLRDEALSAAKQCMELYKDVRIFYSQTSYSYIENFSDEQRKGVVKCLGEQGLVSVSDDINMENYQKVEKFYSVYLSGGDATMGRSLSMWMAYALKEGTRKTDFRSISP